MADWLEREVGPAAVRRAPTADLPPEGPPRYQDERSTEAGV
ncbi:hypothetical protein [Streptomyces sp. BBFR109]